MSRRAWCVCVIPIHERTAIELSSNTGGVCLVTGDATPDPPDGRALGGLARPCDGPSLASSFMLGRARRAGRGEREARREATRGTVLDFTALSYSRADRGGDRKNEIFSM